MKLEDKQALQKEIHQVINQFLQEWRDSPFLWLQEIDIQVEIASRISRVLRLQGLHTIQAHHSHYSGTHSFSRVTCEPYVKVQGSPTYVHPDIVVWDDGDDSNQTLNSGEWPILWVCEIKYVAEQPNDDDLHRLQQIVARETTASACWLKMLLGPSVSHGGINWMQSGRIEICEALRKAD